MKIGITGATGTLGKRLRSILIERGNHVISFCRNRDSAKAAFGPSAEVIDGDITRADSLAPFIVDLDICIHMAAQVDHADRNSYLNVNVNGTKNICETIMNINRKCRLIYCSSIAVLRLHKMKTNYSISKAKAEEIVKSLMTKGLKATIIYPGLIFGPGDKRFVPYLIKGLKTGRIPLVEGGESWAPVIYIDDLCELFIKVTESNYAIGKSYLGIQQTPAGMHDFIKIVAKQCGCPSPEKKVSKLRLLCTVLALEWLQSIPIITRKNQLNKRIVDILSINYNPLSFENEKQLGWIPRTTMESGVKSFLNRNEIQYN